MERIKKINKIISIIMISLIMLLTFNILNTKTNALVSYTNYHKVKSGETITLKYSVPINYMLQIANVEKSQNLKIKKYYTSYDNPYMAFLEVEALGSGKSQFNVEIYYADTKKITKGQPKEVVKTIIEVEKEKEKTESNKTQEEAKQNVIKNAVVSDKKNNTNSGNKSGDVISRLSKNTNNIKSTTTNNSKTEDNKIEEDLNKVAAEKLDSNKLEKVNNEELEKIKQVDTAKINELNQQNKEKNDGTDLNNNTKDKQKQRLIIGGIAVFTGILAFVGIGIIVKNKQN